MFTTMYFQARSQGGHPPLQSRKCNRPILPPKRLKILDVPIHQSCHFLQEHAKRLFAAETGDFNL